MISQWHSNGDIVRYVRSLSSTETCQWIIKDTKYRLLIEVMQGLTYLHSNGVVHGDLKGANVLVADDGSARLCDFGLSAVLTDCSVTFSQQTLKGTCRWMAPELLTEDDAKHTMLSDIWAIGGLFTEVFGGVAPFHTKKNAQQVILALARQERPDRPSSMDSLEWGLVEECYQYCPRYRPPAPVLVWELRIQRMLAEAPKDAQRQRSLAVQADCIYSICALMRRAGVNEDGLYHHTCTLLNLYSRQPLGPQRADLFTAPCAKYVVDGVSLILYACVRSMVAGKGHFPDSGRALEPSLTAVLRLMQTADQQLPWTYCSMFSHGDLQLLKKILQPSDCCILEMLGDRWSFSPLNSLNPVNASPFPTMSYKYLTSD